MTIAPDDTTTAAETSHPAPPTSSDDGGKAQLAEGVQLIGEYEGSGYKEPPSMVRRADGQVIQLPDLLYRLASRADGKKTDAQLATELSADIHRQLEADDVHFLVEEKLRPLGILAAADGSSPSADKVDPFLAFRFRIGVVSEQTSALLGEVFKPLFFPVVVLAALIGLVAADYWLFFIHGVAQAVRQSLVHPGIFLPLFGAVVIAAALHEIGHAAACRYGGGHPGKMGCGLYLAWPAFYTDVTDTYRLSRRARLRTDLGGVYLNVIIVLATVGAYLATRLEPLLLLVLIEHLEIVHQLLPIVRLDGYYIVADLTGVPDLFARIGPILNSAVPGRRPDERVTVLKRWVRWAVTAWVLVVVPLLAFEMLTVLIHLPRILATAGASADKLWHDTGQAFSDGKAFNAISDILQLIVLAIPILGIVLMLWRFAKQAVLWAWKHTAGRPVRRGLAGIAAAGCVILLAMAWIPKHNYRSIQPHERGTLGEGIVALRYLPQHPSQLDRKAAAHDLSQTSTTVTRAQSGTSTTVVGAQGATSTTLRNSFAPTTLGFTTTTIRSFTTTSRTPTTLGTSATTLPGRQTLPPRP